MNNKTHITFFKWLATFVVIAIIVGKAYEIGLNRPPLKYAAIPTSTQDYLRNLTKNGKELGISFTEQGPFNWNNKEDFGQEESQKWRKEEDENFVVYYHHDSQALWQGRAQDVLRHARENIDYLRDLFDVYFYASDMNGRRLAIYLAENEGTYSNTIAALMEQPRVDVSGSLGITITQIGSFGCLTKGIVLHPACFENEDYDMNGFIKVLQHEMCHYVFFSALDYSKNIFHYKWVSEGIAEYFCDRHEHCQVHGEDSITFIQDNCLLTQEFPNESDAAYWAGESFFRFLEKKGKKAEVKKFIQNAFTHDTDSVFIIQQQSPEEVHQQWVRTLNDWNYRVESDSESAKNEI